MKNQKLIKVGMYPNTFNKLLNTNLPCTEIYKSEGLQIHIEKRHPNCIQYIDNINNIISKPDYIGLNPKEPQSIELVKTYDDNVLIGIKLDIENNYLYVASLYDISNGKLQRRLLSGRLKIFNPIYLDKIE